MSSRQITGNSKPMRFLRKKRPACQRTKSMLNLFLAGRPRFTLAPLSAYQGFIETEATCLFPEDRKILESHFISLLYTLRSDTFIPSSTRGKNSINKGSKLSCKGLPLLLF